MVLPATALPVHCVAGIVAGLVIVLGVAAAAEKKSIICDEALRSSTPTCDVVVLVQLMFAPVKKLG